MMLLMTFSSSVSGGGDVVEFARGQHDLPKSFVFEGKTFDSEAYLAGAMTTGYFQRNDFEPTRESLALWRAIAAELN